MSVIKKRIIGVAVFLAALLAILIVASLLFRPKNTVKEAGMWYASAFGYMAEHEDSIDVCLLGDSDAYCNYVPLDIWHEYGITMYDCGTPSQPLYQSYEYLKTFCEYQTPKVVILDTDNMFMTFDISDAIMNEMEQILPVFRYHDRWKTLKARDFDLEVDYEHQENNRGYLFSDEVKAADASEWMKNTKGTYAKVPAKQRIFFELIRNYCNDHGIKLVLMGTPSTATWGIRQHAGVQELADMYGLEYYDFNTEELSTEIGIDWTTDSRDGGQHLNYNGASKVTKWVGNYLNNLGILEDHRGDSIYADWDKAYQKFVDEYINKKK